MSPGTASSRGGHGADSGGCPRVRRRHSGWGVSVSSSGPGWCGRATWRALAGARRSAHPAAPSRSGRTRPGRRRGRRVSCRAYPAGSRLHKGTARCRTWPCRSRRGCLPPETPGPRGFAATQPGTVRPVPTCRPRAARAGSAPSRVCGGFPGDGAWVEDRLLRVDSTDSIDEFSGATSFSLAAAADHPRAGIAMSGSSQVMNSINAGWPSRVRARSA